MFDRATKIDQAFAECIQGADFDRYLPKGPSSSVTAETLVDIFDTQIMSRHLDFMARRTKGQTFYTIGSSGHEGLAALAIESRLTDMAFLHYRDAAFCIQRRKSVEGSTPLWDMALSFTASSEDPVSGGRHKVLGGVDIFTPPQTSTIASHLPKAVGAAHAVCLGHSTLPKDAVILCSFGDASSNHSTAQGAINSASWASYQGSPMPLVFVCEDNNIGISVRTPRGWIEANYKNRPGLKYIVCDGTNILDALRGCREALDYARTRRKPVFLHFKTVRLMGHAGADIEAKYTPLVDVERVEDSDPILKTAAILVDRNILSPDQIVERYEDMRARVSRVAELSFTRPKLETADQVKDSLTPNHHNPPVALPTSKALQAKGVEVDGRPLTLSKTINRTLTELMVQYPNSLVFGEDVGRKGGVYGVTMDLLKSFGPKRVQDTLLDEQTILGLAIGAAQTGYLPIPEIQFLAYLHNAEDQIRGEAATLSFFSDGQCTNPMVIRIAGLGYQRGFGGHFHNDNSVAVLRDIPGIILVCPSGPDDARRLLRSSMKLAHEQGRVVIFLEPIALYHTADLQDGNKAWTAPYILPQDDTSISLGEMGQYGTGTDVCVLTYGNGYYLSRKALGALSDRVQIHDMRWLNPLPMEAILDAVRPCKSIVIVDECRKTGSVSEEIMAGLTDAGMTLPVHRVTGHDSFIPLGQVAYSVLPSEHDILKAVEAFL